jgi:hypothetical protein
LTGAIALAAASPSEARDGRNAAAAIGFGAGALVGAAVVGSANRGYYRGPGYYYNEPAYAYEPGYVEPAPTYYYRDRPSYYRDRPSGRVINGRDVPSCATDGGYGKIDYSAC